jgi:hypothetical protein
MRRNRFRFFAFALWCAASLALAATEANDDDPMNDPTVQKTLRAMNDASTWYHPDLFGEFAGVKRYVSKNYRDAMKYFEIGAYYADKFSQLSIGLMYVNGEGVPKDTLTGYAWIDIAAERDYPDFVATRDRVKASLTPDDLQRAQIIRDKLALRYADKVAKPRMEQQLRFGREQMTGSHLGFDQGVKHDSPKGTQCKGGVYVGGVSLPEAGCGGDDIYADSRWKPEKYFARRDSQWKATVTVGDISDGGAATAPTPNSSTPATDAAKPATPTQH